MPDSQNLITSKGARTAAEAQISEMGDTRTLVEAMNMALRYGTEYMDEMPLLGEPGNFRLSKTKDGLAPADREVPLAPSFRQPSLKKATLGPVSIPNVVAPPPPIQTDVPPVTSKKSAKGNDRSSLTPAGAYPKPKRRKSKAATSSAG